MEINKICLYLIKKHKLSENIFDFVNTNRNFFLHGFIRLNFFKFIVSIYIIRSLNLFSVVICLIHFDLESLTGVRQKSLARSVKN